MKRLKEFYSVTFLALFKFVCCELEVSPENLIPPVNGGLRVTGSYDGDDLKTHDLPAGHLKRLGEHATPTQGEIVELDYMIGGKDFYKEFIRKRKPVVFRGVTLEWNATKYWKNEAYLLQNYADVIFDVELGKKFNGDLNPRRTMDMREFLSSFKNNSMYLDSPFPHTPLMRDLQLPLMMQCEALFRSFTSMHLLFSNGGTSSPLHADGYENFLSLFSGEKVVFIIDPKYGTHLYMKTVKDFPGLSPINPESVDLVKYPLFADVPFSKVVLKEGDMLYIPHGWYHQVRSFQSPNIAASMWFQYFTNILKADFSFRSQLEQEDAFAKIIDEAPEVIKCINQDMGIQSFASINLTGLPLVEKVNASVNNDFINNTVLFEEVDLGTPTIFVGSDDRWIYAFDMNSGRVKWKVETANDTGSTCAFNMKGSLVFCGADDGYVRAMHVRNGSVIWAFKTGSAVVSSAVLDESDTIFIGSLDHYFYAITSGGQMLWKMMLQAPIWSSPVFHPREGLIFISTQYDKKASFNVFVLRKETGQALWKKYFPAGFVASPRLSEDLTTVYFCDSWGTVHILDALTGAKISSIRAGNDYVMASPAFGKDKMYVLFNSGLLVAIDIVGRKTVWSMELGKSEMGSSSSPLFGVDGGLYVAGGNGSMYALAPNDGSVYWRTDLGSGIYFSSPRVSSNGMLFVGSIDGPLHALNVTNGELMWSAKTGGPLVGTALITREFV